jgi:hypothetical protein
MNLRSAIVLCLVSVAISACRFGAEIAMSGTGNSRTFSVTSGGSPACVRGISVYAETDLKRPIWAVRLRDQVSEGSCKAEFAIDQPAPTGYELVIPLKRPLPAGRYTTEASGSSWQAKTFSWSVR